jgi:vacuolar-type H+-ATPase subunit H
MGSRPEELRNEIEQTREELAYDVDRLADHTVPSRVVGRKVASVKERARSVANRVMGARDSVHDTTSSAGDRARQTATRAGDKVQQTAHSVTATVRETPHAVAQQTRGNPLAAGVIAFGVGLLVASLLPETDAEKRAGAVVADRSDDLVDKARETAREMASDLGDTAKDAAGSIKDTARQAASHTAEQAKASGRSTVEQTRHTVS